MNRTRATRWALGVLIGVVLLIASTAHAQNQYLTVSAGTLPKFQLVGTGPTSSSNLTIQASWKLSCKLGFYCGGDSVTVCVAMNSPMTGTKTNTDTIAPSSVQVDPPGNTSWTSLGSAGTACGVTGAIQVGSQTDSKPVANNWNGSLSVSVGVRLNGYSANLAADTYTGAITVIADAVY